MKADLRKSGIEIIGEVPWGTHFCQFYQGKEDLIEILVPYFKQGLENNEFCMWVTAEPLNVEDAKSALKEKVKNLDDYIKKSQIEILDYSQWYTKTGRFDADKVLEGWVEKEKQAVERGFDGLRLTGNTFWLEKKDWKNFADYEAIVNSVIGKHRMLVICSYSLDKCQASEIVDVVSDHQFAIIRKEGEWVSLESSERKKAEEELRLAYKKLKHAQQELIQASKMAAMGQLAAGISHELNQPLTGIKGFAQAVLMDLEKESPFRNDLNKIVEQVDRMDIIIKNVRFFARESDFKIVELDVNQVILDSLMLLSQQLNVHNIRVIQELGSDIPKIQGYPNQLQQAFLNIISNARDAILSLNRPEGGEIRIRTALSQDKNHVEIIFQDTGCGIPEENLQHIFSPFYTTKSSDRGMGLGLSITYRIIENHQGKIEFKSKAGEGTIFRIVLPLKGTKHKMESHPGQSPGFPGRNPDPFSSAA